MTSPSSPPPDDILAALRASKRFPKVALDALDQLLSGAAAIEALRVKDACPSHHTPLETFKTAAISSPYLASGWHEDPTRPGLRWMGRTATLIAPKLSSQRQRLILHVDGRIRRAHLHKLQVSADGQLLQGRLQRLALSRWRWSAELPPADSPPAPYRLVSLAASGTGAAAGLTQPASIALSGFEIKPQTA